MENKSLGIDALGREACLITLKNASGMSVTLTNFGARLVSVMAPDRDGNIADVCLGFDSLADYETRSGYLGATIGRWGNRIANASFELNGKTYALYANNGKNTLHGGQKGFDKKFWEYSAKGAQGLSFHYTSPDGEEGFPGNLNTTVSFTLEDDGSLAISYEATSDRDTVVNLTNHAYFNLRGEGRGDVLDHRLELRCSSYLPVDARRIPLKGAPRPVEGGPFDFRVSKPLGRDMAATGQGYDHCLVIDADCAAEGKPFAHLREPETGRNLRMWTSMPGVQLYTGNKLADIGGKNGSVYGPHGGLCLETQYFPDSPNREDYPSCVAEPGLPWRHRTEYRFSLE